jgi:hypothetical protein
MPRVKGLAFRSVLQALESLEGASAVERTKRLLDPDTAQRLAIITASTWYPVEDYINLWTALQSATGNRRDLPRLIGRRAVELDLKLIHRLAFAALSVSTVLGISARLFNTYYDTGRCQSERISDRVVRVTFDGCVGFSAHMWTELRGAIECFAEQSSKMRAVSTVVSGGQDGDTTFVADVSWLVAPE